MSIETESEKKCYESKDANLAYEIAISYRDRELLYYTEQEAIFWLINAIQFGLQYNQDFLTNFFKPFKFKGSTMFYCQPIFKHYNTLEKKIIRNHIFDVLRNHVYFTKISFPPNVDYTDELINSLVVFLEKPNNVTHLDLGSVIGSHGDRLNAKTVKPIADILKFNTTLEHIDFGDTFIGDEGVLYVKKCIQQNPYHKIKYINFFSCGVKDSDTFRGFDIINININIYCNPCTGNLLF